MLLIVMGTSSTYLQSQVFTNAASSAITAGNSTRIGGTQKIQKGNGVSVFITQRAIDCFFFIEPNNLILKGVELEFEIDERTYKRYEIKDFVLDKDTIFFCGIKTIQNLSNSRTETVGFIGYVECAGSQATHVEIPLVQTMNKVKTYIDNQGQRIVVGIGKQTIGTTSLYDYFVKYTIPNSTLTMFSCPYPNSDFTDRVELLQDIAVTDDYVGLVFAIDEPDEIIYDRSGNNIAHYGYILRRFDRNNFTQKYFGMAFRHTTMDYDNGLGGYDFKLEHDFGNEIAYNYTCCLNSNGIGSTYGWNVTRNNYYYNILRRADLSNYVLQYSNPYIPSDYLISLYYKIDSSDNELKVRNMAFVEDNINYGLFGNLCILKEKNWSNNQVEEAVFKIPCYSTGPWNHYIATQNYLQESIPILKVSNSVYGYPASWNHIIKSGDNHFSMIGVTKESIFNISTRTWCGKLSIFDKSLDFNSTACNEINNCNIRYGIYFSEYDMYWYPLPDMPMVYNNMSITTQTINIRSLDDDQIYQKCSN
ncbi:MAG: hypothetical protein LBO06_03820 [Bacteroidales bacterium]|nr:hypothetical protein [Bacteroidales bacterium]